MSKFPYLSLFFSILWAPQHPPLTPCASEFFFAGLLNLHKDTEPHCGSGESTVLAAVPLWKPVVHGKLGAAKEVSLGRLSLVILPFLPSCHLHTIFAVFALKCAEYVGCIFGPRSAI